MELSEKLQELRKEKGLTQEELAEALFVSRTAISKWESGRGVPNIESLKAISKFFSVSIDELLSGEEILKIADEDNKQKEKHTSDLVFGLLDCSLIMFLFLPFFGQKGDEIIKEVSLLSLTGTPQYIKIPYLIIVFGIVLTGVLLLALQNYEAVFWLKHKHQISIVLNTVATIEFMITLQPLAAFFTFVFLAIKSLMLIKWRWYEACRQCDGEILFIFIHSAYIVNRRKPNNYGKGLIKMKKEKSQKVLLSGIAMVVLFILWTVAISLIDVQPIGPQNSSVGFATLNGFIHSLTGVHMAIYTVTDWLGLIPLCFILGFALLGLIQLIKRKSLFKVDSSILVLGAFYIVVMAAYLFFEFYVVNYRPVLINGFLEASYPSSTTLLVMCVMPTAVMQLNSRIRNTKMKRAFAFALIAFTAFMVIGRLISGVHWITDIIGGAILSAGLVMIYYSVTTLIARQER